MSKSKVYLINLRSKPSQNILKKLDNLVIKTGIEKIEVNCAYKAIKVGKDRIAHIDYALCTGCGQCVAVCQYDAATIGDLMIIRLYPTLGIAASFDPVALDQACADMVKAAPALQGSRIFNEQNQEDMRGKDKFKLAHPDTFWQTGIERAVRIGLGSSDFELINI